MLPPSSCEPGVQEKVEPFLENLQSRRNSVSPPKIAMIGAGSVVFTLNLLGDILSFPELAECEIALMDIDPERLRIAEIMARKVADAQRHRLCRS